MIRVFIVDDSSFVRKALRRSLASAPDIRVVGEARSAEEALRLVPDADPDVVTLDVAMEGMDGLAALREQPAQCGEAVHPFHCHVERHHVGVGVGDEPQRFLGAPGLAHHANVGSACKAPAKGLTHEGGVVDDEDADHPSFALHW